MDMNQLLQRYGDLRYEPAGNDEMISYMVVYICKYHVRSDDASLS